MLTEIMSLGEIHKIEGSKPAKNLINGGSVKVIKAVPRFVGATDGINIGTGNIKLNDIVIRGDDVTTTTTGLNTSLYKIAKEISLVLIVLA